MLNELYAKNEFFSKYFLFLNTFIFVTWHICQGNISLSYLICFTKSSNFGKSGLASQGVMKELEGSWLKLTPARRLLVTFRLLGRSLNNGPRLVMVQPSNR